jgi:hypothetical protein
MAMVRQVVRSGSDAEAAYGLWWRRLGRPVASVTWVDLGVAILRGNGTKAGQTEGLTGEATRCGGDSVVLRSLAQQG